MHHDPAAVAVGRRNRDEHRHHRARARPRLMDDRFDRAVRRSRPRATGLVLDAVLHRKVHGVVPRAVVTFGRLRGESCHLLTGRAVVARHAGKQVRYQGRTPEALFYGTVRGPSVSRLRRFLFTWRVDKRGAGRGSWVDDAPSRSRQRRRYRAVLRAAQAPAVSTRRPSRTAASDGA